jgi:hypothetical protein
MDTNNDFDRSNKADAGGPVVGMILAYVALFLLLTAFTAPAHARARPFSVGPDLARAAVAAPLTVAGSLSRTSRQSPSPLSPSAPSHRE